jgi:membrane-bound lytic murein transglycosylase D
VKKGEKLAVIAAQYRTTGEEISQRNGLSGPKAVRPGMDLVVPVAMQVADLFADTGADWHETRRVARGKHGTSGGRRGAGRYAVRKGDTLQSISRRFGVSVANLQRWNRLSGGLGKTRSLVVSPPRAAGPKTAKAGKKSGAKKRRG